MLSDIVGRRFLFAPIMLFPPAHSAQIEITQVNSLEITLDSISPFQNRLYLSTAGDGVLTLVYLRNSIRQFLSVGLFFADYPIPLLIIGGF